MNASFTKRPIGRGPFSPMPFANSTPTAPAKLALHRITAGRATSTALLVAALALAGCGRQAESTGSTPLLPPVKVTLATARVENLPTLTEVMGVARPVQHAQLAAKVMGTIEEIPVVLGQPVHRGDLLVKIGAGEISARVVQAQSQLNAARRDLERERDLLAKGASTADMVKGLEDRFSAAQAMVHEAETMLGYTTIRAPFEGVVAHKLVNAGDLASPGFPLLEIEGTSSFAVEADVPNSLVGQLKIGAALAVEIPSLGTTFTGNLSELSSAADASAHTVRAKIAVPSEVSIRSGEFAKVRVPGPAVPTLLLPSTAVSRTGQMERVFVAETGPAQRAQAVLRLVKTGAIRDDRVEILAGIDAGERVVIDPPAGLCEGQPLEATP